MISYDIVCEWHKNVWERSRILPPQLRLSSTVENVTFLVPKFHLPAHITACTIKHSFNLTRHVGRTDGETPERGWANTNALATSTRESGPGSRRDTLDDHFNDWNWKKITGLGELVVFLFCIASSSVLIGFLGASLLSKIKEAVPNATARIVEFVDFEKVLPEEEIGLWKEQIEAWEDDASAPNPFETRVKCSYKFNFKSTDEG